MRVTGLRQKAPLENLSYWHLPAIFVVLLRVRKVESPVRWCANKQVRGGSFVTVNCVRKMVLFTRLFFYFLKASGFIFEEKCRFIVKKMSLIKAQQILFLFSTSHACICVCDFPTKGCFRAWNAMDFRDRRENRFVIMDRCQPLPLPDTRRGRPPKVGENKLYPPYGSI